MQSFPQKIRNTDQNNKNQYNKIICLYKVPTANSGLTYACMYMFGGSIYANNIHDIFNRLHFYILSF